jgi:hypothetical protein
MIFKFKEYIIIAASASKTKKNVSNEEKELDELLNWAS